MSEPLDLPSKEDLEWIKSRANDGIYERGGAEEEESCARVNTIIDKLMRLHDGR